jgi:uncharacterized metal-binding protein YceD (DUF177 family)
MKPELHRPIDPASVPARGMDVLVEATDQECPALAVRMNLPAVRALRCRFHLVPDGEAAVLAYGHLEAVVVQTCVISLEEFEATVAEAFRVRFVPSGTETEDDDPDSIDELPFEGRVIDLGEAAVEQLGLALDPYPRMPGAELPIEDEADGAHPFAGLRALRRPS